MSNRGRRVSAVLATWLAFAAVAAMGATTGSPALTAESGPKLESILDLDARFGVPFPSDPWSPDGRHLALGAGGGPSGTDGGIYVFDMDQPSAPPRRITRSTSYFVWSPDGKWLGILLKPNSSSSMGSILAYPVDGDQA